MVKNRMKNLDDIVSSIFILITILTIIANVTMRYFFNSPIKNAEEIATICFVWSIFIGGASAYRRKMHVGVDMLVEHIPVRFKKLMNVSINVIFTTIVGLILYLSVKFSYISRYKPTAALGISSLYVNSALVVGFGLIFIYSIMEIHRSFMKEEERHE